MNYNTALTNQVFKRDKKFTTHGIDPCVQTIKPPTYKTLAKDTSIVEQTAPIELSESEIIELIDSRLTQASQDVDPNFEYSNSKFARKQIRSSKQQRRKPPRTKTKYKPHSGETFTLDSIPVLTPKQVKGDLFDLVESVHSALDHVPEEQRSSMQEWVGHMECIAIMSYHLKNSTCWSDIVVAVIGFAKMYIKTPSLLAEIFKMVEKEEETLETQAWEASKIRDNWNLFKSHPMFSKITTLIAGVLSLSVCQLKEVSWSPLGFDLIRIKATETAMSGFDFIDSTINVFTWLWETGYVCIQTGSLAPMLYADQEMAKFNEDCDYVLAHADTACAGNITDLNAFTQKVKTSLEKVIALKKAKSSGPTAIWLQNKYSQLVNIEEKLISKQKNTAIRFAPVGFLLTGPSGVGKSTLSKLTMKTSLHSMGFSSSPDCILTMDQDDKYQSTYTSDIEGVFIDDVGNTKSKFVEKAISSYVIKMFNNMAAQAVKAELNEKGRVFINFKCGVMSSNLTDGGFGEFTNCLESVLRRFYSVRVKIKQEFQKPGGVSLNTDHKDLKKGDITKDVWVVDIEECAVIEHKLGKNSPKMVPTMIDLPGRGLIEAKNLSLTEYLQAVVILSQRHADTQRRVVKMSEEFDAMEMCETCFMPKPLCTCLKPHAFEDVSSLATQIVKNVVMNRVKSVCAPITMINSLLGYMPIQRMATRALEREVAEGLDMTVTPYLISMTPLCVLNSHFGTYCLNWWASSAAYRGIRGRVRKLGRLFMFAMFLSAYLFYHGHKSAKNLFLGTLLITVLVLPYLTFGYYKRIQAVKAEYIKRKDALPQSALFMKTNSSKCVLVVATAAVGIAMMKLWNTSRVNELKSHGCRDEEPGWFGWVFGPERFNTKSDPKVAHSTTKQMVDKASRNSCRVSIVREDGSGTSCVAFFPVKSMVWIPRHVFHVKGDLSTPPSRVITCNFRRNGATGSKFSCKVSYGQTYSLEDMDMVACYIPNCPDFATLRHLLPLEKPTGSTIAKFVVRDSDLNNVQETVSVQMGMASHTSLHFYGGTYKSKLAKQGACMGFVLSDTSSPCIVGFHIAGDSVTQRGAMQTVLQSDFDKCVEQLNAVYGVNLSAQAGEIPKTQYSLPLVVSDTIHPACMLAKAGENDCVEILGATRLRSTQKSRVVQSDLSPIIEKVMGVANQWGPPKMTPNYDAFNKTLEHVVDPADTFDPDLLQMAMQDWIQPLNTAMKSWKKEEGFAPLTEKESIMGIDGKRFIDAIPMNTSTGFPLFQSKHKWFLETRDDSNILLDRKPHPDIHVEMERLLSAWRLGQRGYPVTSATLKDEPTLLGKDKVRVFQGGSIAFGLQLRKYFLPVLRFLHFHPTLSESAVGVNAFGPEWEILMTHAEKYAEDDKMIAWDYSKYDVRMNSQMTRAVLYLFIELAETGGYSQADLKIMRTMVVDLVHPLIDWNGVMFMAFNMNTSGNNLTVDINGTAGSLYVRTAFFNLFQTVKVGDFRSKVAALTYGDDFIGSVQKDYRDFNFEYFKSFLMKHKMKVTLPSKDDSSSEFLDKSDVDFLKRKSSYISEIGCSIGRLDEMSIFKSLHSNVKSKNITSSELQVSVIRGAMHEWFAHGRDVYDLRRDQMEEVCTLADLPIHDLLVSFDARAAHWKLTNS